MASQIHDVRSYAFSRSEALLFDANIWLFMHGPQPDPTDTRTIIYSGALKKALQAGCSIAVNCLILSEYVNRYHKYHYQILPQESRPAWRVYRKKPHFAVIAGNIVEDVRRILTFSRRADEHLPSLDLNRLLTTYGNDGWEFNDLLIAELCRSHRTTLVTHDADFVSYELTILTANENMLRLTEAG